MDELKSAPASLATARKNHIQEHVQEAENLPEASRNRRAFLQLSALDVIGALPLWNAATSQATQAKNAALPMPIVNAELEPKKSRSPKGKANNKEKYDMPHLKVNTLKDAETIHLGSTTVYVLEDGSLTDNRIGTVFSTLVPHTKFLPQHLHRMHDETFFVTQGTIRFAVNQEEHDVKVGDYVAVPIGAPHTFSNPFDEPAAFLSTFTPAYYVNYFRELGKSASTGKEPSAEEMLTIRSHYATELV